MRVLPGLALSATLLAGCSASPAPEPSPRPVPASSPSAPATSSASTPPEKPAGGTPSPTRTRTPSPTPTARLDAGRILDDIDHLAEDIGPREATSKAYDEAADWVERRFESLGYEVRRTKVSVPAGSSWGTRVRKGTSENVVAVRPGFDAKAKHVVVGAHLDTVPVAPGAEDNGSGVAVMLELARLTASVPPDVGVQFVAFAAEEPRGTGDALHHFGSTQLVDDMSRAERRAIVGMVALDRVGVRAGYVPVAFGGRGTDEVRDRLRDVADDLDIATRAGENTSSDHWSYEKVGVPAARVGSVPYAGYHSRGDVPSVVDRRQLERVTRIVWGWVREPD